MTGFDDAVAALRTKFPLAKPWVDWWMRADVSCVLFPCLSKMDSEMSKKLPKTTNAQEAMHRSFYLTW